ncbi:MAG: murein biosynthesis integral membrane protein MurJ [Proteobacteria bacterium]|nr:murein biosynthesis integral membrane protein MurJ [Pseudomonadota bacterium]
MSESPNESPASGRGRRLASATLLLAGSVALSRVMGYLREVALADQVGAGPEADAYYAAFLLPDLLNYLLAGGALTIAFLPFYTRVRRRDGEAAAHALVSQVLGNLGLVIALLSVAVWWWAEPLVDVLFGGFDPETRALTVRLTRIVLPAQFFFVTGGILRAVLMAHERFLAHALAPVLYNGATIAGGLLTGTVEGFAWGVLVGAVLGPWLVPLVDVLRTTGLRLRFRPAAAVFRRYLWIALPLMVGVSLTTVDEWYDRVLGDALGAGAVAWLSYARKLMQAPVAVVGQAVATAALPTLTRLWNEGRTAELQDLLLRTLRMAVGLSVLLAAALGVLAGPLVVLVYEHGRFGAGDTARVAALLQVFAWAVPGWVAQQIAVRAFYAREEFWRAMLLGSGIALAALPIYLLGRETWGAEGLAAAGAAAMTANAVATLVWGRVRHGGPDLPPLVGTVARSAGIAALAGAAAWFVQPRSGGHTGALVDLAVGGAAFAVVAAAGVALLGDAPLRELSGRVFRRLRRSG